MKPVCIVALSGVFSWFVSLISVYEYGLDNAVINQSIGNNSKQSQIHKFSTLDQNLSIHRDGCTLIHKHVKSNVHLHLHKLSPCKAYHGRRGPLLAFKKKGMCLLSKRWPELHLACLVQTAFIISQMFFYIRLWNFLKRSTLGLAISNSNWKSSLV